MNRNHRTLSIRASASVAPLRPLSDAERKHVPGSLRAVGNHPYLQSGQFVECRAAPSRAYPDALPERIRLGRVRRDTRLSAERVNSSPARVGGQQSIPRDTECRGNLPTHVPSRSAGAGRFKCITIGVLAALLFGGAILSAMDWPQWRGTKRLGVWTETGILLEFPDEGLIVKWRAPVNGGFAGPAVAGGRVFVLDYLETEPAYGRERILALDEDTGEVLWSHEWDTTYRMLMMSYATGPRATPTVDGDRVYLTGATGRIFSLDAATGTVIWEKDTVAECNARIPIWGTSIAPLVDGDLVIFGVGGEPDALVMAFNKHTGEEVWRALEIGTEMGYSQLSIIAAGGARQLIVWHPRGLVSLNPETGAVHWEEPFRGGEAPIADPVRSDSFLLVSGFYTGSMMMRLSADRPSATLLWKGERSNRILDNGVEVAETHGLHSNITTPLIVGDYIYGICSHGQVRGLRADTGERIWEAEGLTTRNRWASAHFVQHEDRYFVFNENGELIIAQFTPEGYVELDRTHLLNPTSRTGYGTSRAGTVSRTRHGRSDRMVVWAHPAFANRHVVLRNDEEIIRVSLDEGDY